jgi:hypothetical protein
MYWIAALNDVEHVVPPFVMVISTGDPEGTGPGAVTPVGHVPGIVVRGGAVNVRLVPVAFTVAATL